MPVNWDPFQREALAELGHTLYRVRAAHAVDEAMLAKLAHATGIDADVLRDQADIAAATTKLRGDATAKRVLWPRLRALRTSARRR
jgi:hypothetical protein